MDGTKGVGADPDQKLPVCRLGDIKSVEQSGRLIRLRSGNMRLAKLVLHHPRNVVERVSIVVRTGINHVDDIEPAESFAGRNLGRVDGGSGFLHVHDLADFLLVSDGYFEIGSRAKLDTGFIECIEVFLFDMLLILSCRQIQERAASPEIGLAAEWRLSGQLDRKASGGDGDSVFVNHCNGGGRYGLRDSGADQGERKEESTHAHEHILRSDALRAAGFSPAKRTDDAFHRQTGTANPGGIDTETIPAARTIN